MPATKGNGPNTTLIEIIGENAPAGVAAGVAQAVGVAVGDLPNTRLGAISAAQLRAVCSLLDRSADELLGIGMGAATDEERRLLQVWRTTDERGRQLIATAAGLSQGWTEKSAFRIVEGSGRRRAGQR